MSVAAVNMNGLCQITMIMCLRQVSVVNPYLSCNIISLNVVYLDHATVMRYDERAVDQNEFDSDHFYCRFDLEYRARKILVSVHRLLEAEVITFIPLIAKCFEYCLLLRCIL
jgi:hypothetical protein